MRGAIAIAKCFGAAPVAVLVALLAGCAASPKSALPPEAAPPQSVVAPAPAPAPPPRRVSPPRAARPSPEKRSSVAVLFDAAAPSSAAVAAELERVLPPSRYRVTPVPLGGAPLADAAANAAAVVAVGLKAARAARAELPDEPLVFCEVYGYEPLLAGGGRVWGVEPLPPLELQLERWRLLDPALHRVALIVGEGSPGLAAAAARAAEGIGVELRVADSSSDRETLYLFKRLADEIDGLWLFPDNRVLSAPVLRELLGYAAAHGVAVLTFNDALLPWGALLSVSSEPADVAAEAARILERVVAGRTAELPALSPLTRIRVQVNQKVAAGLDSSRAPPVSTATHGYE